VTDIPALAARAAILRERHTNGPLILPNAWDVTSARAVVAAGFPVVATTSAGVDDSLGFADHDVAPADEVFAAVARIARGVEVPVTADLEGGYGLEPDEFVDRMLAAGAVGCNLEDSDYSRPDVPALVPVAVHAARLAAVKDAGRAHGVDVVVNARIDLWVRRVSTDDDARREEAVTRAAAYRAAGADCVYPIAANDAATIAALVPGGPVNILALPGGPAIEELARLGVTRISVGSLLHRAMRADLGARLEHLAAGRLTDALG
jgi:2-methylisocitrate lyase-like PEP mutase family enzyme